MYKTGAPFSGAPVFCFAFFGGFVYEVLPQQLRLYAVTDRTWLNGRRLADVVAQAIDGGATFVQLREKYLDEHDLLAEARNCPPCATSVMCRL